MKVANTLITGETGSGKTTLARRLATLSPRLLVMDQLGDYGPDDFRHAGQPEPPAYVPTFEDFWTLYREVRGGDFHIVVTSLETDVQLQALRLLWESQRREALPPVAVLMEEASYYSSTGSMPSIVEEVGTKGRHYGVNMIYVTQRDTQIHPSLQQNALIVASFRNRKPSRWTRDLYTREELERIAKLTKIEDPSELPVQGTHFLVDPPEVDLFHAWAETVRALP